MALRPSLRRGMLGLALAAAFAGCSSPNPSSEQSQRAAASVDSVAKDSLESFPWRDLASYGAFVQSTINEYYEREVRSLYDYFGIDDDLPHYGFEGNNGFTFFDCQGARYSPRADSIYFCSSCDEEMFAKYADYYRRRIPGFEDDLAKTLRYYIRHEAAHAFYYGLAREMGAEHLFVAKPINESPLEYILHNLVEEGVAEYMAHFGELSPMALRLSDDDFKKMVDEEDPYRLYWLGERLVKPILDLDFDRGVRELIRNPLRRQDLHDLSGYRERLLLSTMDVAPHLADRSEAAQRGGPVLLRGAPEK